MPQHSVSRRHFLGVAGTGAAAGVFTPLRPVCAALQAAGIKPIDLTIKEVKVYVLKSGDQIASLVTSTGIEGNYTLAGRYFHPNWSNLGWLEYARKALPGKSILEFPEFTNQYRSNVGQLSYASAINNCAWDILGKAVNLPVYRLLGAYRDRVRAYASSQHLKTVDDFVADLKHAKGDGFTAYKIHPPWLPDNTVDYRLDIEVAKAVRKYAGDDFPLLFDRVGGYTRDEAIKVGRALDQLNYVSYEDPIPTSDIDGLAQLAQALDLPITIGEFLFSPYDFTEYIRRGACDVVRFIVDNIGGITGGMKVARLAECFGMECQPHNWGTALDHAVHFHCELAMPNNIWFEMTQPQGSTDRPYFKDQIRIDKEGYVPAPTKPGLGYEIDRNVLDNLMKTVER
ncbi:MAG: mandelate racemase/muconate lactonizing enzyme family protein [Terriglobia bacterium]